MTSGRGGRLGRRLERGTVRAAAKDAGDDAEFTQGDLLNDGRPRDDRPAERSGDSGGSHRGPVRADESGPSSNSTRNSPAETTPSVPSAAAEALVQESDRQQAVADAASDPTPPSSRTSPSRLSAEEIRELRDRVAAHPGDVDARLTLASALEADGKLEAALDEARQASEHGSERRDVRLRLASILTAVGRFEAADEQVRRVLKTSPSDMEAHMVMGVLQFRRGLYAEAVEEFRMVVERYPDDVQAHFHRGEALNRLGDADGALRSLQRVIELDPRHARAYHTMGILYDRKALPEEAAAMYRRARALARP